MERRGGREDEGYLSGDGHPRGRKALLALSDGAIQLLLLSSQGLHLLLPALPLLMGMLQVLNGWGRWRDSGQIIATSQALGLISPSELLTFL